MVRRYAAPPPARASRAARARGPRAPGRSQRRQCARRRARGAGSRCASRRHRSGTALVSPAGAPARAGARGGRRPLDQRLEGHQHRVDGGRGGGDGPALRAAARRPAQGGAVHAVGTHAPGEVPAGDRVRRVGRADRAGSRRQGAARAWHDVRGCGRTRARGRTPRRRGAVVSRVLELRHVQELRGTGCDVPNARGADVRDVRWETRLLALVAAVLVVFGLTAVYGASSLLMISGGQVGSSFALKQALGAAVGGIVAALLARSDYRKWQRAAWPVLGVVAVLLLLPLLPFTQAIAPNINGARRWVNLGFVTVQPSELAKFAVVVWTAMLAAKKGERIRTFQYGLLPFLVVLVPLVALIFLEPNLSMAVLVTLLAGVVLFTAGARIGHFLTIAVVATPILFGAVASAQYRLARVVTFLNPGSAPSEATWQVHQSLVGMGAGRLFGVGLGQGQQKLGYLPYAYSDFIFSTIGEEWGFLGVLALIVLFGTFAWLGFRIAKSAGDPFGRLLAVGLTGMIGITAVLHIGVTLALLPATGITLPFISYGRSSLFVALVATGVLISIGRGRRAAGPS